MGLYCTLCLGVHMSCIEPDSDSPEARVANLQIVVLHSACHLATLIDTPDQVHIEPALVREALVQLRHVARNIGAA